MTNNRILTHPVLGKLINQTTLLFTFDGETYEGYEGDTIASALMANGIRKLRVHEETGSARGIYCNIGHCFECRVTVNQVPGIRACLHQLTGDMIIESGKVQPTPLIKTMDSDELPRTYAAFTKGSEGSDSDV